MSNPRSVAVQTRAAILAEMRWSPQIAATSAESAGSVLKKRVARRLQMQTGWLWVSQEAVKMEAAGLLTIERINQGRWGLICLTSAGKQAARDIEISQHVELNGDATATA